ncbi:MAG: hypothetical protein SVX38_12285 [Chloroflexota bacterium]|nr:hypothetical protein [Chloroflexota bacterium]
MEIKILSYFMFFNRKRVELTLAQMVNEGWQIVAACGAGSFPS